MQEVFFQAPSGYRRRHVNLTGGPPIFFREVIIDGQIPREFMRDLLALENPENPRGVARRLGYSFPWLSPKMGSPVECAANFCRWPVRVVEQVELVPNFSSSLVTWLPAKFRNACWRCPSQLDSLGRCPCGRVVGRAGARGHILAPSRPRSPSLPD